MLDNNHRGHPLKFQHFRSSNHFMKVTGKTSRKFTVCETDLGEENSKHCILTYVDQSILNPVNLPNFGSEISNIDSSEEVDICLIRGISNCASTTKVDINGGRVSNYIRVHIIASTIKETLIPLLTAYNKTTKNTSNGRISQHHT